MKKIHTNENVEEGMLAIFVKEVLNTCLSVRGLSVIGSHCVEKNWNNTEMLIIFNQVRGGLLVRVKKQLCCHK